MEALKAYKITEVDKKTSAAFTNFIIHQLDPGEVVVRVAYSGVNSKDALTTTGKGRTLLRPECISGIDSVIRPMTLRQEVWRRLATDMKPVNLDSIATTIPFADLPGVFDSIIQSKAIGRTVVEIGGI